MEGFEWAENNLGLGTPHELQAAGANVYFAPNIRSQARVVNLANGRIDQFQEAEERPKSGYYADYESLVRYCREREIPLSETNGQVSTQPVGTEEAGDPLPHGGP